MDKRNNNNVYEERYKMAENWLEGQNNNKVGSRCVLMTNLVPCNYRGQPTDNLHPTLDKSSSNDANSRTTNENASWADEIYPSSLCGSTSLSVSSYNSDPVLPSYNDSARNYFNEESCHATPNVTNTTSSGIQTFPRNEQTKHSNEPKKSVSFISLKVGKTSPEARDNNCKQYKIDKIELAPQSRVKHRKFTAQLKPQNPNQYTTSNTRRSLQNSPIDLDKEIIYKSIDEKLKQSSINNKHFVSKSPILRLSPVSKQSGRHSSTISPTSSSSENERRSLTPNTNVVKVTTNQVQKSNIQIHYPKIVHNPTCQLDEDEITSPEISPRNSPKYEDVVDRTFKDRIIFNPIPGPSDFIETSNEEISINHPNNNITLEKHITAPKSQTKQCNVKIVEPGTQEMKLKDRNLVSKISAQSRKGKQKSKLKLIWPPPEAQTDEEQVKETLIIPAKKKDFVSPICLGDTGTDGSDFVRLNISPNEMFKESLTSVRTPVAELQAKLSGAVKDSPIRQADNNKKLSNLKRNNKVYSTAVQVLPSLKAENFTQQTDVRTPTSELQMTLEGAVSSNPLRKLNLIPMPPNKPKTIDLTTHENSREARSRRGVIRMNPKQEKDCTHTVVHPSTMMTLAMELHLAKDGKAKKLFQEGKRKAEGDDVNDNETNLDKLWVLSKDDSDTGEVMATHLKPNINTDDEKNAHDKISLQPLQKVQDVIEEDLSVEALVGAPDTVYSDSEDDDVENIFTKPVDEPTVKFNVRESDNENNVAIGKNKIDCFVKEKSLDDKVINKTKKNVKEFIDNERMERDYLKMETKSFENTFNEERNNSEEVVETVQKVFIPKSSCPVVPNENRKHTESHNFPEKNSKNVQVSAVAVNFRGDDVCEENLNTKHTAGGGKFRLQVKYGKHGDKQKDKVKKQVEDSVSSFDSLTSTGSNESSLTYITDDGSVTSPMTSLWESCDTNSDIPRYCVSTPQSSWDNLTFDSICSNTSKMSTVSAPNHFSSDNFLEFNNNNNSSNVSIYTQDAISDTSYVTAENISVTPSIVTLPIFDFLTGFEDDDENSVSDKNQTFHSEANSRDSKTNSHPQNCDVIKLESSKAAKFPCDFQKRDSQSEKKSLYVNLHTSACMQRENMQDDVIIHSSGIDFASAPKSLDVVRSHLSDSRASSFDKDDSTEELVEPNCAALQENLITVKRWSWSGSSSDSEVGESKIRQTNFRLSLKPDPKRNRRRNLKKKRVDKVTIRRSIEGNVCKTISDDSLQRNIEHLRSKTKKSFLDEKKIKMRSDPTGMSSNNQAYNVNVEGGSKVSLVPVCGQNSGEIYSVNDSSDGFYLPNRNNKNIKSSNSFPTTWNSNQNNSQNLSPIYVETPIAPRRTNQLSNAPIHATSTNIENINNNSLNKTPYKQGKAKKLYLSEASMKLAGDEYKSTKTKSASPCFKNRTFCCMSGAVSSSDNSSDTNDYDADEKDGGILTAEKSLEIVDGSKIIGGTRAANEFSFIQVSSSKKLKTERTKQASPIQPTTPGGRGKLRRCEIIEETAEEENEEESVVTPHIDFAKSCQLFGGQVTTHRRQKSGSKPMDTLKVPGESTSSVSSEEPIESKVRCNGSTTSDNDADSGVEDGPTKNVREIRAMFNKNYDYAQYAKPRAYNKSPTSPKPEEVAFPYPTQPATHNKPLVQQQVRGLFQGVFDINNPPVPPPRSVPPKTKEVNNNIETGPKLSVAEKVAAFNDAKPPVVSKVEEEERNPVVESPGNPPPPAPVEENNNLVVEKPAEKQEVNGIEARPRLVAPDDFDTKQDANDIKETLAQVQQEKNTISSYDESLDQFYNVLEELSL